MSEDNIGSADPKVDVQPKENNVVSEKAYEEVSRDMHKFKKEREELKAALNEVKTQLKLQEETKMQEQEQWKELYEKTKAETEEEKAKLMQEKQQYMKSVKKAALKSELGGKIKDRYLDFADLDQIVVNEGGLIDADSLLAVANEYRKEHGQLIQSDENNDITGHASTNLDNFAPKSIKDMSHEEKVEALAALYANKK